MPTARRGVYANSGLYFVWTCQISLSYVYKSSFVVNTYPELLFSSRFLPMHWRLLYFTTARFRRQSSFALNSFTENKKLKLSREASCWGLVVDPGHGAGMRALCRQNWYPLRSRHGHILASPAQPGASIVCVFSHIFHATNPPAGLWISCIFKRL